MEWQIMYVDIIFQYYLVCDVKKEQCTGDIYWWELAALLHCTLITLFVVLNDKTLLHIGPNQTKIRDKINIKILSYLPSYQYTGMLVFVADFKYL